MPIPSRFLLAAFLPVAWGSSHLMAESPQSHIVNRPVETRHLLPIEAAVLPPPLMAGPPAHDNLPAYYAAANPQLVERFERIDQMYATPATRSCRAVTLVAGDAGMGKTFLKNKVLHENHPAGAVFKLDIREQYEKWFRQGIVGLKPDLYCGEEVINSLLTITDKQDTPLLRLLEDKSADFFVIDSLDELHPDDYVRTLEQIEQFTRLPDRRFVHVVVFGRPCALVRYWATRAHSPAKDIQLFMLRPPQLRTTGDLLVSSWNYCSWKFAAHRATADGETIPVPFSQFAKWSSADFIRSEKFSTISVRPNNELTPSVRDTLLRYARKKPVVGAMLYNLAGNSILREIVAQRVHQDMPYNERAIMDAYFEALLERDYQSDGRPSFDHPAHVELYLQLLEKVAAKYAAEDNLDAEGYFVIADGDQIYIQHDGQPLHFPTQRILDRSGLNHINPRETGPRRYRFEPIWMHRYLTDRHNERLTQTALRID